MKPDLITCKYGIIEEVKEEDKLAYPVMPVDGRVVKCGNIKCHDLYCTFSYFTGGQISDELCDHFEPKNRNKIERYHL